jgi:hypothetical protein
MSASTHPSPENLSAFFDRELPADERIPVEAHLAGCPSCRAEMDAFAVLSELGPRIEESLPGDAYWKDLPDRILARIVNPGPAAPHPGPAPSWWQRVWHPQGRMQVAWGAAAMLAVTAVAWVVMQGQPNPWRPVPVPEIAENIAPSDPGEPVLQTGDHSELANHVLPDYANRPDSDPTPSPQSYIRRVYTTYGDRNNLGMLLDVAEGETQRATRGPGIGQQVTQTLDEYGAPSSQGSVDDAASRLRLGPEARSSAQGVVIHGCGEEDPIESAFLAALKALESGNYEMARQGFLIVRDKLPPTESLRHEAEFRLQYIQWRERLESAFGERVQAMNELHRLANASYQDWERSQARRDCQEAWCMNKVLLNLAPELANQSQAQVMLTRVNKLKGCVE